MADARMPDRYLLDRRFVRLPDEHFRSYVLALMWSVSNRTDGEILPDDLGLIPGFRDGSARALVTEGLWTPREQGWQITDYLDTQTTRAQFQAMEAKRANDRARQARHRAKKSDDDGGPDGGVTHDVTRDVTADNKGKARQGQARTEAKPHQELQPQDSGSFSSSVPDSQSSDPYEWAWESA